MSFYHKNLNATSTVISTFYAFTFPFTYAENLKQLEKFDELYGKTPNEIENFIQAIHSKRKGNKNSIIKTDSNTMKLSRGNTIDRSTETKDLETFSTNDSSKVTTNESVQHLTNLVNNVKIELCQDDDTDSIAKDVLKSEGEPQTKSLTKLDNLDDIYYHRDLIILSYEKRRIDLLTITSYHGIKNKREEWLPNLYPDDKSTRCNLFRDKKIIFISSRVHPGETPASFVLNGFLNLLFDRNSTIANTLRSV